MNVAIAAMVLALAGGEHPKVQSLDTARFLERLVPPSGLNWPEDASTLSPEQLRQMLQPIEHASGSALLGTLGTQFSGGQCFFIRVLPLDEWGKTRTFTNPTITEHGVYGYSLSRIADLDPTQPASTPEKKPASQPTNPPPREPKSEPKKDAKPAPSAQPTLDELLGLPKTPAPAPKDASAKDPASKDGEAQGEVKDPNAAALDEVLSGKQINDAFEQAVALMGDASKRLNAGGDPGIDTQRIQEDIIKKLDQVLDSMQQQQQQSSSKSKPQQRQTPQQPQGSQRQQQQQQAQQPSGENRGDTTPPGLQEGALRPGLEGARAAWGSLPQRVRDMLLQGSGDRFSAKYQAMTEAYYRKLAEEKENK